MDTEFKLENFYPKDGDNLEMLRQSLESKEIDAEIVPILKKFFSLPITPLESCYGHMEESKLPYLSYVEDDAQNEKDKHFQKLFKENLPRLSTRINSRIGSEAMRINLEEIDHGGGPKDYTLRFEIIDGKKFQAAGKVFLAIIWEEFSKYIDGLKN